MHRFLEFAAAVLKHWGALVTGGAAIGLLGVWQGTGHAVRASVYWAIAIIALFIAFYKAWQDKAEQADRAKGALAASEETIKQTEARLYDGRPILVLRVAEIAGSRESPGINYDKSPRPPAKNRKLPKFTIDIRNCGDRTARWITLSDARSQQDKYRLMFARVTSLEARESSHLSFEVQRIVGGQIATLDEFLSDTAQDVYLTWYDITISFRDTHESIREEIARLSYWPEAYVLASSEVPYTQRDFKQQ